MSKDMVSGWMLMYVNNVIPMNTDVIPMLYVLQTLQFVGVLDFQTVAYVRLFIHQINYI